MRVLLAALSILSLAAPAMAADAGWIRYPALSPDGEQVAFSYRGDLWVVPSSGGAARRLTSHDGYEYRPVWSRDGSRLAFAADWHGNMDVYVVAAVGGQATRLTYHSTSDVPCDFEPDGSRVLFTSRRQDAPASILPSSRISELWSIPVAGGRPQMELTTPAQHVQVSPDGTQLLYEDRRGYENDWRKHHTSPVTRDIWLYDRATGTHRQLTNWGGEDRNPVWTADGAGFLFLSERDGAFDVWSASIANDAEPQQVSSHETHPARFLSRGGERVAYTFAGQLFVGVPGGAITAITVRCSDDARRNPQFEDTLRKGATELKVSPKGDEVAFVVRGDVYVASVEHGTTKRVTATPQQERSVSWAPDGKTLYYAGERRYVHDALPAWNIYRATLAADDEERFYRATKLVEETFLAGPDDTFRPLVSPDGKNVAFLRNRDEIAVMDVAGDQTIKTVVPAARNYSYADGDIQYSWSPDSKFLAVSYLPNKSWIEQIGIADIAAGRVVDVTLSGYYESGPTWSPDGRALLFKSDRHGRRSHGGWGSDDDVMALYLTQEAFDRAKLSKEDYDQIAEAEKKEERKKWKGKRGKPGEDGDGGDEGDDEEDEPPPEVKVEWNRIDKRLKRLTRHSAPISGYAATKDGEAVVYFGAVDGKWDVWLSRPRDGVTRKLLRFDDDRGGDVQFSKDGKELFVRRAGGQIMHAKVEGALGEKGGDANAKPVGYAAEFDVITADEREYIFEHAWRQAGRKFYNPNLHGTDWPALREHYLPFLPEIENNYDFAELLSELLGELNASHTGSRYRHSDEDGDRTASLGLLFETQWETDGLRVAEVLRGGPADRADSKIKPGHVLTAIDGTVLGPDVNPWRLLDRKAGKRLRVTLRDGAASYDEVLRPIGGGPEGQLLYERLIERRRKIVDQASGGRVGYLHVRGMSDASYRVAYREALGRSADKEALIVDTRFNGGGWLHDDLTVFLMGKKYLDFVPRGKTRGNMGGEPLQRWHKPSCVVMSEGNYSDAHMFPWVYREHGIGKLVGAPVAGTGTAVWWENQIDNSIVFGIPQVGMVASDGSYLENATLEPDVLVLTDPVKIAEGTDEQLLAAVRVMIEELGK